MLPQRHHVRIVIDPASWREGIGSAEARRPHQRATILVGRLIRPRRRTPAGVAVAGDLEGSGIVSLPARPKSLSATQNMMSIPGNMCALPFPRLPGCTTPDWV